MASSPKRQSGTPSEKRDTGIEVSQKQEIAERLAEVFAGTYALLLKTHACHWNIVGPAFLPLHKLTEYQYKNLFEAADVLAERIRALGYRAPVSFEKMLPKSDVPEEKALRPAAAMAAALVKDHETMARQIRSIAGDADAADDLVTTDLLTHRLNFHEKAIWMLGATIEQ
jgi:starvation-inducible DNA-binding protein